MSAFNDYIRSNIGWLKNEVKRHPQWLPYPNGNNLAPETDEILEYLICLNKLGFYTVCSQPINRYNSYAFVNGFITLKMYNNLSKICHMYPNIDFEFGNLPKFYDTNLKNIRFIWIKSEILDFWPTLMNIFNKMKTLYST